MTAQTLAGALAPRPTARFSSPGSARVIPPVRPTTSAPSPLVEVEALGSVEGFRPPEVMPLAAFRAVTDQLSPGVSA